MVLIVNLLIINVQIFIYLFKLTNRKQINYNTLYPYPTNDHGSIFIYAYVRESKTLNSIV